jgi:hypothetical protein
MSTAGVLDLWSDDIRANVLTPIAILRTQVSALSRKAEGILRAEVRTDINQEKVELYLNLIAPALNDYQVPLLKAWHDSELVYPATVKSRGLLPQQTKPIQMPTNLADAFFPRERNIPPDERIAETQEEFIKVISDVLRSGWVRSLIQSLIARSNDILAEKGSAENGAPPSTESPTE